MYEHVKYAYKPYNKHGFHSSLGVQYAPVAFLHELYA